MSFRGPVSSAANSSLGAVGGARGTAAGAIRILVEFLTQYDSKAVKQLESDLASLETQETGALNRSLQSQKALETSTRRRVDAEKQLQKLISSTAPKPGTVRTELKEIQRIGVLSKEGQRRLKILDQELQGQGKIHGLATKIAREKRSELAFTTRLRNENKALGILSEQRLASETQLTGLQKLKGSVLPKLGGLALGALGGVVGGAVLGVGFAAAEAALEKIGEGLQRIFDPGRKARDIIRELGAAINALDDGEDVGAAVIKFLEQAGLAADKATVALLSKVAADVKVAEGIKLIGQITEVSKQASALENETVKARAKVLIDEALARGEVLKLTIDQTVETYKLVPVLAFENQARQEGTGILQGQADATARLAAAQRQLAASAQLATFAEQQLVSAISGAAAAHAAGTADKISGLQDSAGPSAKTTALEAKLEALSSAGGGRGKNQELQNIAEERSLILLRQKLRLQGANIDLEKFSGKFLLEAIHAKQKALQKEADAQDRLNKALDLQFKMSQTIRRNEGESITDFVERRAQENRSFLSEQRDLEREAVEERLNELEEKTQDEVALQELAERKKNAAAQGGANTRIKSLQKELEASRKADADALKAKIEALRKAEEGYQILAQKAEEYATEGKNAQIQAALSAADTVKKISQLSGEINGLTAAYSFISTLVASGAFSGGELSGMLDSLARIKKTLGLYDAKLDAHTDPRTRKLIYKEGGILRLNNASTPFGANVRAGEEGDEYAVVLQHKIAEGLKNTMKGVGDVGPFYVQRSESWLNDRYQLKRAVKEAVAEALR